ncbi:Flavohemoprotein [Planctomycetes bacterium MalM25]|nr:Flavohemoprotein [Planctomycetes bacterium MalM25]
MAPPGNPLLFYVGAVLCAYVAGQAIKGAAGVWWRRQEQRRRNDRDAEAFRQEAATAAESARARLSRQLAWEGRRELVVSAVVDESPDVKSLYLIDPESRPLPRFLPGQYLTLALPAGPGGEEVVRCYSLSDRPHPEYYRLSIRRQDAPSDTPEAPPGVASHWLHRHAKKGLRLACEAPRGAFFYNPGEPRPAVLIGAGVGVTPLVAMLEAADHEQLRTATHAVFGFRDGAAHLFADRVREIAAANPLITTLFAYSSPGDEDQAGTHYDTAGRVTLETLRAALPSSNFDFFLCGPPQMMQALVPELLDWGVPEEAIHFEAFGPASVSLGGTAADKAIGSPVRFAPNEDPHVWDGECSSLLEMAEAIGVPLASGCRAGNCGACRVRVVEGKTINVRSPGTLTEDDECLACISLPDGPVTIET